MDEEIVLMARLQFGETDALSELYRRLGPHVFSLSFRLLQSREEAEEVVQDVFARLGSGRHGYKVVLGSPRAFIYTMARNAALSRLRVRSARPVTIDPELVPSEMFAAQQADLDVQITVQSAINQMPSRDRELVLDAFFQGLSHPEIATERKLPLGTVKTRLRRALLSLRGRLREV